MSDPDKKTESLAERSARLEREAMEGKFVPSSPSDTIYGSDSLDMNEQPEESSETTQEQKAVSDDGLENYQSAADAYVPETTSQPTEQTEVSPELENATIQALQAEADSSKEKMMRAVAEAENTKRRMLKEMSDTKKYAVSSFSRDLLSVADNLRRALEAVPEDVKEDVRLSNLIEGIEATERELLRNFEKNGIQKLEPLDQVFDPNFHEVMFEAPVPGKAAGTIIQVVETGYILHDRLLRPARVGVAKAGGDDAGDTSPPTSSEPGHNIDTEA